ncbi:MAG: sel1 repeat family protein, partial [Nitrospira sp.]|nr:sel1 repeat family protein [Nitrospira sp.]
LTWFRRAAAPGFAGPQNNLALMYERGRGVRKDLVRAFMWYHLASAMLPGDDGRAASIRRDQLSAHMTASQIEQAQELATRCQQSQFKQCD